jgi:preprotein translocase subunit SecY
MGLSFWLQGMGARYEAPVVPNPGLGFVLMTVITLTTGTAFLMWLGEQISERGIGNGISLIIFAGIVAVIPSAVYKTFVKFVDQGFSGLYVMLPIIAIIVLGTAAVVIMLQAQRKIPVQYAKRVVGRKIYGGQATHIPLQINPAGVIPVIFASSILAFPATFSAFFGGENRIMQTIQRLFEDGSLTYCIIFFILTIFFVYFYTAIVFNPVDIAENMRKWGGFIPGIRPGRATASYIEKVLSRILLTGAIFLGLIAILPYVLIKGLDLPFFFGGTSLLIVVGVDLDTMKQIESHMLMRHYEGFMKKGKIKARF